MKILIYLSMIIINLKDIINSYYNKFNYIILKSPKNLNLNKDDYLYEKIHTNIDKDNKILLIIFEKLVN